MFGIQRQTCRHCVIQAYDISRSLGLCKDEIFFEVRNVAMSYWCLHCLQTSIEAGICTPKDLRIARNCQKHKADLKIQFCPCNNLWAYCRDCMVQAKPRAGTALCHRCFSPRGAGRGFCGCSSRLDTPARRLIFAPESPASPSTAASLDLWASAQAGIDDAAVALGLSWDPTMHRIAADDYVYTNIHD